MDTYPQKAISLEAAQWTGKAEDATQIIDWVLTADLAARYHEYVPARRSSTGYVISSHIPAHIAIETPHGTVRAEPEDWVIRDPNGDFRVCTADVFQATFDVPARVA
jgi:hypothetical protein